MSHRRRPWAPATIPPIVAMLALLSCDRPEGGGPAPDLGAGTRAPLGPAPRPEAPAGPDPGPLDPPPGASQEERLRFYQELLDREPGDRRALRGVMIAAELRGLELVGDGRRDESIPFLDRAADAARGLLRLDQPLDEVEREFAAGVLYNEACNRALTGQPDRAIDSLRLALELGFSDPIIHEDQELASLRDRPDFRELLERAPAPTPRDGAEDGDDDPGPGGPVK